MSNTTMTREEQLNWSKEIHPETIRNNMCTYHLNKNCNCPRCRRLKNRIESEEL